MADSVYKLIAAAEQITGKVASVKKPNAGDPSTWQIVFDSAGIVDDVADDALMADIHALADTLQEPAIDPLTRPLSAAQFEAGLVILGVDSAAIEPAIKAAISDPVQQAFALGRWRRLVTIERDNATLALLKAVFSVTDEQIDDMWRTVSQVS